MGDALDEAPAVVVAAKACGGMVTSVRGIKDRANLIHGNPLPGKFDVGGVALLGDAGDGDQFAAGGGNAKGLFCGVGRSDEALEGIDAGGGECDIPAGGSDKGGIARSFAGGDPPAMLQFEIFRGEIVFVGNETGAELKLLRGAERVGGGDQVSGEAAGEEVAGRAGGEHEETYDTEDED